MIERLGERKEFALLRSEGCRGRAGPLTVVRRARPDADRPAVAFSIPRRVGTAVLRNRRRRQLRAVFTELARSGELGTDAYLVILAPHREWPDHATLGDLVRRAAVIT